MPRTDAIRTPGPVCDVLSRWEWRTFAYEPDRWRALLAGRQAEGGELLAQTCFVARSGLVDTKLRARRIEVKLLGAVSPDGLELWHRKPGYTFPLPADPLTALTRLWGCGPPPSTATLQGPEELMTLVSRACPGVRAVSVRIWRRFFDVDGCAVERATLLAEGQMLESLRFTHQDPESLRRTLTRLEFRPSLNTNTSRMLRQLIHWPDVEPVPSPSCALRGPASGGGGALHDSLGHSS